MNALREPLYRLVLTGELRPGLTEEAALRGLAEILGRSPERLRGVLGRGVHPLDRLYAAHHALELQRRLEQIGVGSRVEASHEGGDASPVASGTPEALRTAPVVDPGRMRCPACGHEQLVAESCERCGVRFEEYNRARRSGGSRVESVAPRETKPATSAVSAPPGWDEADAAAVPGEDEHLALFVGPDAPRYLEAFERYREGERHRFALGWNWRAVFSPFLWALHRKLWWLAALLAIIEVLIPIWLLVLGAWPGAPRHLTFAGLGLLVANRLIWPAVVDYLYLRHARTTIARLDRMSATRLHESQIVAHGGVSLAGVLGGLAFAFVSLMLTFSLVDALGVGKSAFDRGAAYRLGLPQGPAVAPREAPVRAPAPPLSAPLSPSKWAVTRSRLQALGARIDAWSSRGAAAPVAPAELTLSRLHAEAGIPEGDWRDAWGRVIQFIPATDGYRLVSAGPDQLFGTADDIQFRKVLRP